MPVNVQDDAREIEMRDMFGLRLPANHTRGGVDAELVIDGQVLPFELKSTSTGSVTTVRDFGPDHLRTWDGKHWLIGRYAMSGGGLALVKVHYGSPSAMGEWISGKWDYIKPDFKLAEQMSLLMTKANLVEVCGDKEIYSLDDAKRLHKKQYSAAEYRAKMDAPGGYTPQRMLDILVDRAAYLGKRGSTLNNPHIPPSYIEANCQVVSNEEELRVAVRQYLSGGSQRPSQQNFGY
jgi:hypothetical protein